MKCFLPKTTPISSLLSKLINEKYKKIGFENPEFCHLLGPIIRSEHKISKFPLGMFIFMQKSN